MVGHTYLVDSSSGSTPTTPTTTTDINTNSQTGRARARRRPPPPQRRPRRRRQETEAQRLLLFNKIWFILVVAVVVVTEMMLVGDEVVALRMINLDVPETALQGETHTLSCSFSLHSSASNSARRHQTQQQQQQTVKKMDRKVDKYQQQQQQQVAEGNLNDDDEFPQNQHRQQQQLLDEQLYAIKWYKDEREFFRYLAQDWPHKQVLPLEGLNVDICCLTNPLANFASSTMAVSSGAKPRPSNNFQVDRSDNQTLVLRNVSLKTSGSFRCEVSTDAPSFLTKSIERKMHIFALPNEGPSIERPPVVVATSTGANKQQQNKQMRQLMLGDHLELGCSSKESKPAARLDWIINDTLNLSASIPIGVGGEPIFKISHKRLVNLPVQQQQQQQQQRHQPEKPTGDAPSVLLSSSSTHASYEIHDDDDSQTSMAMAMATSMEVVVARPRAPASGPVISLADSQLDQLLESSIGWLNFTVDNNLIQLLSTANPTTTTTTGNSFWSSPKIAQQQTKTTTGAVNTANPSQRKQSTNKSTPGNGSQTKWRKSGGGVGGSVASTNSSGGTTMRQVDVVEQWPLKIKCVARILHLSMSDQIKLKLVNRTKDNHNQIEANQITVEAQRQRGAKQRIEHADRRNSAIKAIRQVNTFICLMAVTSTCVSSLIWTTRIVII